MVSDQESQSEGRSQPTFEGLQLLSDEPVGDQDGDLLEFSPLAKTIAGIGLAQPGPFTVGVFGEWGIGKTSLMRMAKALVDKQAADNVVTVWFNAWQFEREDHPIVPLIGSIIRAIEGDVPRAGLLRWSVGYCARWLKREFSGVDPWLRHRKTVAPKAGSSKHEKALVRALRAIAYSFSVRARFSLAGAAQIEAQFVGKDAVDRYQKYAKSPIAPLLDKSLYHEAFSVLSKSSGHLRVVVFVDDLDRCLPDKAIHLLEAIKLVLLQQGFIFMVGVAPGTLADFLATTYERFGAQDPAARGRSYLDKIIQLPIRVPREEKKFDVFLEQSLAQLSVLQQGAEGAVPPQTHAKMLLEDLVPFLGPICRHNPRSAVRILNNITSDVHLWRLKMGMDMTGEELGFHAVNAAIQQYDSKMYRALVEDRPALAEALLVELQSAMGARIAGAAEEDEERQRREELEGDEERQLREELEGLDWFKRVRSDQTLCSFLLSDWGRLWLERSRERETVGKSSPFEPVRETKPTPTESIRDAIHRACEAADCGPEGLKALDLSHIRGADWSNLPRLLALETLDVRDCGITSDDLGMIADRLAGRLRKLVLNSNAIGNEGLEALLQLGGLAELYLSNNSVTTGGLATLVRLPGLTRIDLERNRIADAGLELLGRLTGLRILNLMRTDVTDVGLSHLSDLNQLKKLHLSRTKISDDGLRWLGTYEALSGLETLFLERTRVSSDGVAHIAGLAQLEILKLRSCKGVDDSALAGH